MIVLHTVNKLMIKNAKTHPEPLPWPSLILRKKQTLMYSLYTSHQKFDITPENKY